MTHQILVRGHIWPLAIHPYRVLLMRLLQVESGPLIIELEKFQAEEQVILEVRVGNQPWQRTEAGPGRSRLHLEIREADLGSYRSHPHVSVEFREVDRKPLWGFRREDMSTVITLSHQPAVRLRSISFDGKVQWQEE